VIRIRHRLTGQHRRTFRLNHVTFRRRVGFLQCCRATGKCSTRADEIAKGINRRARLPQDFRTGVETVRPEIAAMVELVGPERASLLDDAV
jgi:hypothetical protein